jgi:hypothetical protein
MISSAWVFHSIDLSTYRSALTTVASLRFDWENSACWVKCWKSVDIPIAGN